MISKKNVSQLWDDYPIIFLMITINLSRLDDVCMSSCISSQTKAEVKLYLIQ